MHPNEINISDCCIVVTINIVGTKNNWATGGFAGDLGTEVKEGVNTSNHLIQRCYVMANITGRGNTGGFIGSITSNQNLGTYNLIIEDCFVQGNVSGVSTGGWTAEYQNLGTASMNIKMTRLYYAGKVSATNSKLYGAFIGYDSGTSVPATFENCYFDKTISGISKTYGNAVGKTTTELQKTSTFIGWSTDIWQIEDGKYPTLIKNKLNQR